MVPNGWKRTTLGEVAQFKNGLNFSKSDNGEAIKIVGVGDFKDLSELRSTELLETIYVNNAVRDEELLEDGDLLFVRSNGNKDLIGRCLFFPAITARLSYSGFTIRARVNSNLALPEYIASVARSSMMKQQISRSGGGTNISNLSQQILNDVAFLLPPLTEQKKIAQILSTWDQAINVTEQLLTNSQQQKKALMQQLLTGKKRLLDENGVRFSGEWTFYTLSSMAHIVMGSSPKSEAYNEDRVGLPLLQGNADIKNRRSVPRVFTSEITKECEIGDILLSVRAPVGAVALSEHKACIGRGIAALKAKPTFYQGFIYQWLLWFEPRWLSLSQGSTFESINSEDIKNLRIRAPEIAEQQKIAAVLSTADDEITVLQQKLTALKQEKKALMQQLLTGKRRVIVDDVSDN